LSGTEKPVYSEDLKLFATVTQGTPNVPAGVLFSADGVKWRYSKLQVPIAITAVPNGFLVTTDAGVYFYNGQVWNQTGDQTGLYRPLWLTQQLLVAVTINPSQLMVSTDLGVTWQPSSYNGSCVNDLTNGGFVSNGYVVAFPGYACLISSPIASVKKDWHEQDVTGMQGIVDLVYGGDYFVTMDSAGNILMSSDGSNWYSGGQVPVMHGTSGLAVAFDTFFAIGAKGSILSSPIPHQ